MRVLVFGGRTYRDTGLLWAVLDALHARYGVSRVVHGGARGADALGASWGRSRCLDVMCFPADWSTFGRGAGHRRNADMLRVGAPQLAVQCPGGRGTEDMRRRLCEARVPIVEVVL